MVFIHGGGWFAGCSSQNEFHGDFIANSTNTVLVTINYRLGYQTKKNTYHLRKSSLSCKRYLY
jgi:acetyl esterase/lipase